MYVSDVFVLNRWLLRCAGLWFPDNPIFLIPYKIYAIFVFLFVNIYFTCTEFFSLFSTYYNVYDFIKNINFFLTHFMGAVKVTFWFSKGHVLRRIMSVIESDEFQYESISDFNPNAIFKRYKRTGLIYTFSFLMLAHCTLTSSYLPPLLAAISMKNNTTNNITKSIDENLLFSRLPYFSWMPFKHNTKILYLIALGYQAVPMFSYIYSIVGMDTLFMNIMNFIAGHLMVLQGAFRTIRERAIQKCDQNDDLEKVLEIEMKKSCKHLQTIYRCATFLFFFFVFMIFSLNAYRIAGELEEIHKYLTLVQATATLCILCTCLYLISTTPIGSKQFYAEFVYMVAMGFQLYLYCWFGNEVTLKAQQIPLYIWKSNWIDLHKTFKNSMILTMMRAHKPIYLTVGQFAPLTLNTFVTIIKTSYSAFAVLKQTSD